jgi:chorismate mutase/prephenate dehydrogenase
MAVVAIIGGSGRMGRWFADFLSEDGYKIILSDKNECAARKLAKKKRFRFVKNAAEAARLSEIVIVATSTLATKTLLRTLTSHTSRSTLIVEISSIKQPVKKTIQSLTRGGAKIMSIHPMFGPGADNLTGKSVIVSLEPRNCTAAKRLLSAFVKRGARIIRSSLDDHDRLVATTLSLPHLMNFIFVETIRKTGLPIARIRELGGTTFKLQLLIAQALYHESLSNEVSILVDNKYNTRAFTSFEQKFNEFRRLTQRNSQSQLLRRLRNDATYLRNDRLFRIAHEQFVAAVEASTPR